MIFLNSNKIILSGNNSYIRAQTPDFNGISVKQLKCNPFFIVYPLIIVWLKLLIFSQL